MTYNIVKGLDFVLEFCQINKFDQYREIYTIYMGDTFWDIDIKVRRN